MLHQVKKGVWEHLVNLTLQIIKCTYDSRTSNQLILELDLRIRLVPRYSGLRKFSKGISSLSQITAAEYQQLMRVCMLAFYNPIQVREYTINTTFHFQIFIPCVRGLLPSPEIVRCLATFVQWYFYASSPTQTEKTLMDQDALLSQFNELKGPFAEVSPSSLNFPKFHSLLHVSESTRRFGTPDNADTEITEHQHRVEVKTPYQRTNKRNPLPQVIKFVERRTAFENKLDHIVNADKSMDTPRSPITENHRYLSAAISGEAIHIDEGSRMFGIHDLELATQTFFHDLEYTGKGHHHRVNRRNLPKLSNPMVSLLHVRWLFISVYLLIYELMLWFPQITIYTVLSIGVFNPFADNELASDICRQLIRCKQQFHGTPRYDWVAVYDLSDKDFKKRQGIDKYLFAQVRLLFKIKQENKIHQLAYLEWYNITDVSEIPESPRTRAKMAARDPETQMAVAVRSGKFNVVSVNAIVRQVHMQPLFEERNSA